jgi:PAT family beta-lactamase induction signal transducer AmpG
LSAALAAPFRGAGRRRFAVMTAYGFACGLPLPLSGFTLRQWLSEAGISLGTIGLSAVIGLAYALKFLWAPLFDRALIPPGRRRGWLLIVQPLLVVAGVVLALSDPLTRPLATVAAAASLAFFSASQDIIVDAWRIEIFSPSLQGAALACYVWGYRLALLISGALAIKLADLWGWHGALLAMAGLALIGPLATLLAPEPEAAAPDTAGKNVFARLVLAPLREFLSREGAFTALLFIALFKLGEALAGVMLAPFYHALGFNRGAVALANGPISLAATLAGISLGGWLVVRVGAARALIGTGFAQMAAMAMYLALAVSAGAPRVLYATTLTEAFAEGLADAAFLAFLSGLCARAYSATQYALLSSLAALPLRTLGGASGYLAAALGWTRFYALCMLAALPAMLVMVFLLRRYPSLALASRERRLATAGVDG